MGKALAIGLALFLALLILRAPAGLIRLIVPDDAPVALLTLSGTLWNGEGDLLVDAVPLGRLSWSFRPATLLRGAAGYDLSLSGNDLALNGRVDAGLTGAVAQATGSIAADLVNVWLAPYYIELSGTFTLDGVTATLTGRRLSALAGALGWDGGPLTYRLSGKMHRSALPPLRADLGPGPEATVFPQGESVPVLHAAVQDNGFAKFGVTKYLTRILGDPWPGGDPDHAVVLEVEEQVF